VYNNFVVDLLSLLLDNNLFQQEKIVNFVIK